MGRFIPIEWIVTVKSGNVTLAFFYVYAELIIVFYEIFSISAVVQIEAV